MSQQELEKTDQEVINMVNSAAAPDALRKAERVAENIHSRNSAEKDADEAHRKEQEEIRAYVRKRRLVVGAKLLACVAIALLLVSALFWPELLAFVVNAGVLACGCVAAVTIDRWLRSPEWLR